MRVLISSLEANPFRDIEHYPISREKVDSLKASIKDLTFWDNILARPHGKKFQIAYGHHRVAALRELHVQSIDIPVRDLSDADMLRIMANENMDDWKTSPAVMFETVRQAKAFIDAEMAKAETWERVNGSIKSLFESPESFTKTKETGSGQTTILKFLGGNWKQWQIQEALAALTDKEIDIKAIEQFPTLKAAEVARKQFKARKIPKADQAKIAKKVLKGDKASQRQMADAIDEAVGTEQLQKINALNFNRTPELPGLDAWLEDCITWQQSVNSHLKEIFDHKDQVDGARVNVFVNAVRRTAEIITQGMKGDPKWKMLM